MDFKALKQGSKRLLALAHGKFSSAAANAARRTVYKAHEQAGKLDGRAAPFLLYSRPGSVFAAGEPVMVSVYNPDNLPLEIVVRSAGRGQRRTLRKVAWRSNPTTIKLNGEVGHFQIVAQATGLARQRSNSIFGQVVEDTSANAIEIERNRIMEHRLDCAVERSSTGVLTLHDPWIRPGNADVNAKAKWFPTPVWEGATSLYNEEPDYYADPLKYYVDCICDLRDKGFRFVNWHDVIDGKVADPANSILLQFDIDAGPNSFLRVAEELQAREICATAMVHRRARHWYDYDFEDTGAAQLKALERNGWAFGYHHNALTNLVGFDADRAADPDTIAQAAQVMCRDIADLRQSLDIRTLTHHGGNVLNYQVPLPDDHAIVCVDRKFSQALWTPITRSFSDGSFTARPTSLRQFVDDASPGSGMLFMRCHPFKYGNYPDGADIAALSEAKADQPSIANVAAKTANGAPLSRLEKQTAWAMTRKTTRSGVRLGYAGTEKPLGKKFLRNEDIDGNIARLRARRRPGFLRQYPWAEGDPRVIWWRVLSSFCGAGEILNVGAMPPDQKDETLAFLRPGSNLIEIDIDPDREPDILADFCAADFTVERTFDHVLLNGLPYFSNPAAAVENASRCVKPGGCLLIGAAAASHPERGGQFRPGDRPTWRKGQIEHEGESLSLKTMLWSFDDVSVDQLMHDWPGCWEAEFMSHYWFVVAKRRD